MLDYTYKYAKEAHDTGTPIVRPLFTVYPGQKEAWNDWGTYLYGPSFLVSPIWKKGETEHQVYLPAGDQWQNIWTHETFKGGQTVTVKTQLYQQPVFVRMESGIDLGDMNKEYQEGLALAQKKPDMRRLDEVLRAKFDAEEAKREAAGR
jgi:alpha-glucosidase (family GH31 glycosyl hydrolase)